MLVPFPDDGVTGVVGVRDVETPNFDLFIALVVVLVVLVLIAVVGANEILRLGVGLVERPSEDIVLDNCDAGGGGGG